MADAARNTVTVEIAGDEYTIKTEASPDYAVECASLVDETIAEMLRQGPLVDAHKIVILAALSLADQLLQTRDASGQERQRRARLALELASEIEAALPPLELASRR